MVLSVVRVAEHDVPALMKSPVGLNSKEEVYIHTHIYIYIYIYILINYTLMPYIYIYIYTARK